MQQWHCRSAARGGYTPLLDIAVWRRHWLCGLSAFLVLLGAAALALCQLGRAHEPQEFQPTDELELKALWCQSLQPLPALWPAKTDGPPLQVKLLTYNLFWWNLYHIRRGNGGSAGHLIAQTSHPQPYDVMVFQECRSIARVLADTGLAAEYYPAQGAFELCMVFRKAMWTLLDKGQDIVAEDKRIPGQYFGRRSAQWMRLAHKGTGKTLFVMNHHGPLPINTGGLCGGAATAGNLLRAIQKSAVPGDALVLLGDFNANPASQTLSMLAGRLTHLFNGEVCGGIDSIFSNTAANNVVKTMNLGNGGSDHDALSILLQLGPPAPKPAGPPAAPGNASRHPAAELDKFDRLPGFPNGCRCHCEWARALGACAGAGDGTCCFRGCCDKLFPEGRPTLPPPATPHPPAAPAPGLTPAPGLRRPQNPDECVCDWAHKKGACAGPGDGSPCRDVCCGSGGEAEEGGGCLCAWVEKKGACNGTSDGSPCYDACCHIPATLLEAM